MQTTEQYKYFKKALTKCRFMHWIDNLLPNLDNHLDS